jgi:anti-sigma regulatory factor (Ser/Thr protein kinase)
MQSVGEASVPSLGLVHRALIYGSEQEFMDFALPFLEEAIAAEEPTLVAVQERSVENLRAALGGAPPGVTLFSVEQWYDTSARSREKFGRWIADRADRGRVRLIGEPPWAVGHEAQVRDWARHESVLNVAFAEYPVTFICPYDARVLPEDILSHARSTHPQIVGPTGVTDSESYEAPLDFCRRLDHAVAGPGGEPFAELRFGLADLPEVRRAVGSMASEGGLARSRADELVLAVNEIATNAVVHGGPPATLRFWQADGELVFEVSDAGEGIKDALAGQLTPPTAGFGGRGLWVTRLLSDAVEIRNAVGCTVSVHATVPSLGVAA